MSNMVTPASATAWPSAAHLVAQWLDHRERVDVLLDGLPPMSGPERARCQNLFLGVVRHFGRVDAALGTLLERRPRLITSAMLFLAGFELIEASANPDAGRVAKIVHHAVEQAKKLASPAEARMINAVVRKLHATLAGQTPPAVGAAPEALAAYFSHPDWLVRSWLAQFGPEATHALLTWNQQPAPVHARWRAPGEAVPSILKPTAWPDFFAVETGHWTEIDPLLKTGKLYLQDPSTRIPVDLLAPSEGESFLDLCAAPGGKALQIADRVKAAQLVAVDLPTSRIDRLKENLARATHLEVALVQADVLRGLAKILEEHRLPALYSGVLIDVPCSNTGVMRHRVDVKWRLQAGDFKKHPQQQLAMLQVAARLVALGGRLVYSTCSIDTEENEHVVRQFLTTKIGREFALEQSVVSFPWKDGHDGGAAFLLRRA